MQSAAPAGSLRDDDHASPITQTNRDASLASEQEQEQPKAATVPSIEADDTDIPDAPAEDNTSAPSAPNGDGDDAESEAETLITSPVKKKEAEKQQQQQQQQAAIKTEPKPQRSRIGGLPVPGDDDEDPDSAGSPMLSTEDAMPARKDEDADMADDGEGSDRDAEGSESEELSSPQSDDDAEGEEDEDMGRSEHERGDVNGGDSPNPRKRKHRASSASLPNKRRSMDPPKRRLRGMHSEADAAGIARSTSPKLRGHRRAVSTQSALDGASESAAARKRKSQFPVKEPKSVSGRSGWEDSDASSETASRGQPEELLKRSSRGVGRSTSTPGRPGAREFKRHVNRYGFTKLAEACEEGNLDLVKELRERDPDSLELAENAGNTPLQIACLNGNADVVQYLIGQGCKIDCANVDKDTPLIDAAENGHVEVVKLLLDAGVDPLSQNLKGQQALDVVTDDTDDAPSIRAMIHKAIDNWNSSSARQRRAVEEEIRHGTGPSKELHFMARTYDNLLRLVANNDRNGVREFLAARVPVDNAVIAVAAKTGDVYLVNMLLAEMSEKKAGQKSERPMLAVLGSSHWEMVQALTELETFNPMYQDRQGRNWPALAEERAGPNWRKERDLLRKLHDQQAKNLSRRSSSPVSRRDGGGKRFLTRPNRDGNASDEDAPADLRRKNGRRLMSRKDMRAVSSKALSDSSDADEDEDAEGEDDDEVMEEAEGAMGPPDTPNRLRAAARTRSKSAASQNSDVSPRTRRRSASMRELGSGDKALPPVEEAPEEVEVETKSEEQLKAEEAEFAVKEAQRLAAKEKKAAEAEAEAKRAEDEAEAARLRAEEERRVEEERRRKEAEEAEQARQKAAREAEAERQQQLVRDKEAAEAREAREKRKTDALAALPPSLRHVLLPRSEFTYEGLEEKAYLVQHFTPLRVLRGEEWVLNLQAAALVGKDVGLSMLMGEEFNLEVLDLAPDSEARRTVEEVIANFPVTAKSDVDTLMADDDEGDFEAELARTAERFNVLTSLRQTFLSATTTESPLAPRLVKLSDVRQRLHPLLRDVNLELQPPAPVLDIKAPIAENDSLDFFAGLRKLLESQRSGAGMLDRDLMSWTEVAVVHEK